MVNNITDENFNSFINQENQIVLMDFYTDWCMPCKMLKPILEEVSKEGIAQVGKLNIEKNPSISNTLGLKGVPTMILYKNSKQLDIQFGFKNKIQIISWIKKYSS